MESSNSTITGEHFLEEFSKVYYIVKDKDSMYTVRTLCYRIADRTDRFNFNCYPIIINVTTLVFPDGKEYGYHDHLQILTEEPINITLANIHLLKEDLLDAVKICIKLNKKLMKNLKTSYNKVHDFVKELESFKKIETVRITQNEKKYSSKDFC